MTTPQHRRERLWYFIFLSVLCGTCLLGSALLAYVGLRAAPVRGAELALPDYIVCGRMRCNYNDGEPLNKFGTYSPQYMERRWKKMCDAPRATMRCGRRTTWG